jgi:acetoin utilization protein AcuC
LFVNQTLRPENVATAKKNGHLLNKDALFIGSEIYRGSSYGGAHPLRVPRVSTVIDLSRALGLLTSQTYRNSPRAKPLALAAWHDPDYVAALVLAQSRGYVDGETARRYGIGTVSNPVFAQMYSRPATGAGGVMLAAQMLVSGEKQAIYVPGAGTHHGMPDRANGFCYLNDPALGIVTLKRAGMSRIAYVDLDAHHCDGVEFGFSGDAKTRLISVHEENRWPFKGLLTDDGGGNCYNLPVPRGFNDSEMQVVVQELILPVLADFRPEVIILQAGADALEEDPLSRLSLSNNAYCAALRAITPMAPRLLLLGGGGYNPWSVARCWTALWATLSDQAVPAILPTVAQNILQALSWGGGARALPQPHMFNTLIDAPRDGEVRAVIHERIAQLVSRRRP